MSPAQLYKQALEDPAEFSVQLKTFLADLWVCSLFPLLPLPGKPRTTGANLKKDNTGRCMEYSFSNRMKIKPNL